MMKSMKVVSSALLAITLTAGAVACHGATTAPRLGNVYVGTNLSPGFTRFQFTGAEESDWVTDEHGAMKCSYDSNQGWGTAFIVAGQMANVGNRTTMAASPNDYLCVDLKGQYGGETVNIGVKTDTDPDDGKQPGFDIESLTKTWKTYRIPLTAFVKPPDYPATRLSHLYVVFSVNFKPGVPAETVWYRNVKYTH
jgi:hypothetical protein